MILKEPGEQVTCLAILLWLRAKGWHMMGVEMLLLAMKGNSLLL
jgi:hypothetical protein